MRSPSIAASHPPPGALLRKHGLEPKHSWGQNFLGDEGLLQRIAGAGCPDGSRGVIEIGAGLGHLTARLLDRSDRLIAVERDRDMAAVLRAELGPIPGFGLEEANALDVDYGALARELGADRPPVVGNLPYQISSPLLFVLLKHEPALGPWTFLLQKEVADRLAAAPGSRTYGALTVHIALRRNVRRLFTVSRGAFLPAPRVDSAVVRFDLLAAPLAPEAPERARLLHRLVDDAFFARRKTIANSLQRRGWSDAVAMLERAGIEPRRRAETLSPEDFLQLLQYAER